MAMTQPTTEPTATEHSQTVSYSRPRDISPKYPARNGLCQALGAEADEATAFAHWCHGAFHNLAFAMISGQRFRSRDPHRLWPLRRKSERLLAEIPIRH